MCLASCAHALELNISSLPLNTLYDLYAQVEAIDGNSNCMFLAQIDKDDMTVRLLEDDQVTVTAIYSGLYSYRSTLGGKITIPSCLMTKYTIKGYKAPAKATADANGYYWITTQNFEEYARNANAHLQEKIRFTGKVIPVVEGKNRQNVYRIAVDSDIDCVFYVEYTLPKNASRILEDDIVRLSGTYYGLFSYSTTLGAKVTVPATIATEIIDASKTTKQSSSSSTSASRYIAITGTSAIIRTEPSLSGSLIRTAYKGETFLLLGESSDFYKISIGGKTGYVHKGVCSIK